MGATTFFTKSNGRTAEDAFRRAVDEAHHWHGFSGYSGTVAEKESFIELTPPPGEPPEAFAQRLLDANDPRLNDKWGPCVAVQVDEHAWVFVGWASN